MYLSNFSSSRDNNLNLIRVCAATGVLVSHAYPIALGPSAVQPLKPLVGITLGAVCVYIFFIISGFLITQSFERSRSVSKWTAARVMRIFPGLVVVVLLTAFVLGPLATTRTLAAYMSDPAMPLYILRNITLVSLQYELPGVFQSNPYGGAINGSLWTLLHEVACYVGVLLVGLAGLIGSRSGLTAILLAYFVGYLAVGALAQEIELNARITVFRDLSLPFAIGVAFYAWQDRLRLSWWIGLALLPVAYAFWETPLFKESFVAVLAYWTLLVGFLPDGRVRDYNNIGDYSYGVYIYAFPMQQLVVYLFGDISPGQNILMALPLTVLLAMLSWHYVEKPSLALRGQLAGFLQTTSKPKP